ncbi:MAG: DUF47 family protein [Spirochaetales bacterium]|nr:DUF47 family protein [Spirochaetales bacterium]
MLFNRAKSIENNIDKYLENLIKANLIFEKSITAYFELKQEYFEQRTLEIEKLESESDEIRRDIKYTLYKELLIPDARGDVLGLLETLDNVFDTIEKVMVRFSIEKPIVWPELSDDFIELTKASSQCVSELVSASRAFFREISKVPDCLVKVHFWEHEADKIEERIMRKAFDGDFIDKFSLKVHMRYFAERISMLADEAEDVADRLDIYTIKRSI